MAEKDNVVLFVRIPPELRDALDLKAAQLRKERLGTKVSLSDVVRELLCKSLFRE